jgi:hypothetical protein
MAFALNPNRARTWTWVIVLVTMNLFVWCMAHAHLGGDALSGYAENGRYFLNAHGNYTEVSEAAWIYSKVHTILVVASIPITAVFGFWATSDHHGVR